MSNLGVMMVQAELCWQDPAENRERLERQIIEAIDSQSASDDVDLILLPETFSTGFLGDFKREPETMEGATVNWMQQLASRLDAAIGGSIVVGEDGARFNRFLFASPDGGLQYYDKRHLFAYGGEHKHYTAGTRRVIFDYRGWRICPQVCYDLRFPAWCRIRDDYDLLVFVANWPSKRMNAWTALLRARAIENQSCVIGINRVGRDGNGIEYPGQTAAYGPLGEELSNLGDQVATAVVQLDLDGLRQLRSELPFLADADKFSIEI